MSDVEEDVELLREAGAYEDDAAVIEDALRTLLRTKPGLRTELAVEKYRRDRVSVNRAAEIAGLSPAEFRTLLNERGVSRPAGFLSEEERDRRLGGRQMVLVDNNVLSSLAKIQRLSLLDDAFEEVRTTASVLDELHSDAVGGHTFVGRIDGIKRYEGGWFGIVSPTDEEIQLTEAILDSSLTYTDAELIAIADRRAERLLTDDRYVNEVASRRGVETWDLVLLLRTACETGTFETSEALRTVLEDLRREDYYEFSDEDEGYLFDYF